jgi:hypothetical protein
VITVDESGLLNIKACVGRNNQRALRRMVLHSVQCAMVINGQRDYKFRANLTAVLWYVAVSQLFHLVGRARFLCFSLAFSIGYRIQQFNLSGFNSPPLGAMAGDSLRV